MFSSIILFKFVIEFLVLGFLIGPWLVGRWWVVGWPVGRWSVVGGRLVGGFKKTCKTIGLLRKLQKILQRPPLITIFKSFVRSYLDYGHIIYD